MLSVSWYRSFALSSPWNPLTFNTSLAHGIPGFCLHPHPLISIIGTRITNSKNNFSYLPFGLIAAFYLWSAREKKGRKNTQNSEGCVVKVNCYNRHANKKNQAKPRQFARDDKSFIRCTEWSPLIMPSATTTCRKFVRKAAPKNLLREQKHTKNLQILFLSFLGGWCRLGADVKHFRNDLSLRDRARPRRRPAILCAIMVAKFV